MAGISMSVGEFEKLAAMLPQWNRFIVTSFNTFKQNVLRSYRIYGSRRLKPARQELIGIPKERGYVLWAQPRI